MGKFGCNCQENCKMQFLYFLSIYYKKDKWCISLYDFVSFSVTAII